MKEKHAVINNHRYKKYLVLILVIVLNLLSLNNSLAQEISQKASKYPDYSYEFTGADKWESFNRKIFIFNLKANKYVFRPINVLWTSIMPQYGIDRIQSAYTNMNYPVRLVGSLLQDDKQSAKIETKRFFINTTVGFLGLYDVAKSKYKLQPRNEDIEQVLAYHNVKQGPYLVLPVVAQGNTRDIAGQILDLPLNPTSYLFFIGPISMISGGVSFVNGSTYLQPIFKMADDYADPYLVSKQLSGVEKYIKNKNIDRMNFIQETPQPSNFVNVSNTTARNSLKADITLQDYNPQNRETDAIRTMLFDSQKLDTKNTWSELSIWNKSFSKQIKTAAVSVDPQKPKYKYRYILQKDKTAPVAILYPSIGESANSGQSAVFAKILYDKGYSVVIFGSSFNWAFAKSMPDNFKPGLPANDAHYLRLVTSLALNQLKGKYHLNYDKKILVGTSFGGLTGIFVAQQEENDNMLGISKYIFICPPIKIFYALQQIDLFSESLKAQTNLKQESSITAEKVVQVTYNDFNKSKTVALPFVEDEAKLAISYTMRQKLYDLIFTLEKGKPSKKNTIYEMTNDMSFYNYVEKYLLVNERRTVDQLSYDSSLYSIKDFLRKNSNYKIYHSLDDCFTSEDQLSWLKAQTGKKTVLFSNGSHLGFLYRPEFFSEFVKDIKN